MVLQGVSNLISGIIISVIYDWRLMLINIAVVPAVVVVDYLLVLYTTDENKVKMNKQYGDILSEHLVNISTIHSFNAVAMSKSMFSNAVYCGSENDLKYASITGVLNGLTLGVMCFDIAASFYACGVFIINGTLTMTTFIKAFSSLINALYFFNMAMKYVKDISSMNEAINGLYTQIETHSEIPPLMNDSKCNCDKRSFKGKIEFRNVSFAYPTNQSKRIINNVSFVIRPGEKVAFLGASGAGKSTITHLIERFYDVNEGAVLIDDVNVKDIDLVTMRQCVGYVQQEAALFSRSVFENIQYGDINAGVDDVKEVALKCKVLYKVDAVNENDKGKMLSGGEKQRVAIARALIRRPKILLMDEATSALDNETANDIQSMLDEIIKKENMTVVVIAHRLQAVKECDRCFYMNNGKIVHVGTFEEIAKFCK
jgi:ABC-type multidrug transport system fused ATPase/permease subunit